MGYSYLSGEFGITDKQKRFLACYCESASITKASGACKLDRSTHYTWIRESEAYKTAFEECRRVVTDLLTDEAVRRAHDGVTKGVWHNGERVGEELVYSDTLLIFMLKGLDPKTYRDNSSIEVSGKDGKPLLDLESVRAYCQSVKPNDKS